MKHALCVLLLSLSVCSYAADPSSNNGCNNSNPYSKQLCEKLAQSSDTIRQAREEAYKKELSKEEAEMSKRIEGEHKAENTSSLAAQTMPPTATVPDWQKALSPETNASTQRVNTTPPANNAANASNNSGTTIAAVPNPGPTQFATPQTVTLPGGVKMIPVNPKKNSDSGSIKYY